MDHQIDYNYPTETCNCLLERTLAFFDSFSFSLQGLTTELTSGILNEIQKSIRQKDEEMSWADASILQLQIRASSKNEKPESFTFQCRDPNVKKEWTVGKGCLSNNFKFCILFILNRFYN